MKRLEILSRNMALELEQSTLNKVETAAPRKVTNVPKRKGTDVLSSFFGEFEKLTDVSSISRSSREMAGKRKWQRGVGSLLLVKLEQTPGQSSLKCQQYLQRYQILKSWILLLFICFQCISPTCQNEFGEYIHQSRLHI